MRKAPWLLLDDVALDWSPLALLHREARVDLLTARRVQVPRLPVSQPKQAAPANSQPFSLPVRVSVQSLRIARAEIGAPVAGVAAAAGAERPGAFGLALQDGDAGRDDRPAGQRRQLRGARQDRPHPPGRPSSA